MDWEILTNSLTDQVIFQLLSLSSSLLVGINVELLKDKILSYMESMSGKRNQDGSVTCVACGKFVKGYQIVRHMLATHEFGSAEIMAEIDTIVKQNSMKHARHQDKICLICKTVLRNCFSRDLRLHFISKHIV